MITIENRLCTHPKCDNTFKVPKNSHRKYCCHECSKYGHQNISKDILKRRGEKISQAIKKRNGPWNKGLTKNDHPSLKRVGEKSKTRIPANRDPNYTKFVDKICEYCQKSFSIDWPHRKNRFCCQKCATIAVRTGPNNPNWNPNRDEIRCKYTKKFFNINFRQEILKQQDHKCVLCLKFSDSLSRMDLHHIDHDKQNDNRSNLIYLCLSCHNYERHNKEQLQPILYKINNYISNRTLPLFPPHLSDIFHQEYTIAHNIINVQ